MVQPLPRASVIVPPLAELPLIVADEPLAPIEALEPAPLVDGVVPVVDGVEDEEAALLLGDEVVDDAPELVLGEDVLAVAPDGLRSAVIINVIPGSTVNVLASADELVEPMVLLEPIVLLEPVAPDDPEAVEPAVPVPVALRVPDVAEPLAPVDPAPALDAPELPVALEPLRPDVEDVEPIAPVIMMRHGADMLDALEPVVLEAAGELPLLLLCATATAVNMEVDKAANATDDRILRILLSSADLGRHANSRQRIRIERVPVYARLHNAYARGRVLMREKRYLRACGQVSQAPGRMKDPQLRRGSAII